MKRDTMCGRDPRPSALRRDGAVHETIPNEQLRVFVDAEWPERTVLLEWMKAHNINISSFKGVDLLNRMTLLRLSNGGQPPTWRLPDWNGLRSKIAVIVKEYSWDDETGNVDGAVDAIVKAVEELLR